MQKIKGFTIVETLVAVAIFIIISFVLASLCISYYQAYSFQQGMVSGAGSASATANELISSASQATHIVASHVFSGTAYNSGPNTLVLEIPSINSSGDIISGKYDYIVFYLTGARLYKLVQPDGSSSRKSGFKQLSDTVSVLNFSYNNVNLAQADKISVDIQVQNVTHQQVIPYNLHQEIYLRNL